MYKRSAIAIVKNPPPKKVCYIEAQFGEAKYYDIAGTIHTRIDAGGAWFVQVESND